MNKENSKIIALKKVINELTNSWNRYTMENDLPKFELPFSILVDNADGRYICIALKGHEDNVHVSFKLKSNTVIPCGKFNISIDIDSYPHEIFGLIFLTSLLSSNVISLKYAVKDYINT